MKRYGIKILALLLSAMILLCSCGKNGTDATTGTTAGTTASSTGVPQQSTSASVTAGTTTGAVVPPAPSEKIRISDKELYDKLLGGWIGQMVGVTWSASTEFKWCGQIIPEGGMDEWKPSMINNGFGQDDIYVEIPFLDAMNENGALCDVKYMADKFRDSPFPLWHANKEGRDNLRAGIEYPYSGHYLYNKCADDIDWQIECDFLGMMYPGYVNASALRSFDIGHIMNYGDGVYGGVFITAMHAAAYTAESMDEIVEAGVSVIPDNTKFKSLINDVIASYKNGDTWEECWQMLEKKWAYTDKCIGGKGNIDAKLNSAYVLMGLLYGECDMAKTIIISCRCGQDSDCNPSSAASILGNFLGAEAIASEYKSGLDSDGRKFSNTSYTFDEVVELNFKLMKDVLAANGAVCENGVWTLDADAEYVPVPWEQWADEFDVVVKPVHEGNGVVSLGMTVNGKEPISSFEIDMGDGTKFDFVISKYAYKKAGEYTIKWKAVSSSGKQVSHSMKIVLKDEVTVTGTPVCSVTKPTGGGNKDMNVMTDGFVPVKGSSDSGLQYDTYCGGDAVTFAYAGMEFDKPYIISGVEFTEGKHFRDGGWFASAPYVEILKDGKWVRAESVISKAYPENSLEKQGESFETYVFTFDAEIECDGVRISGVPGGSAYFISVGEIAPICEMKNDFENNGIIIPICNVTVPEGSGSKDISVMYDGKKGTDSKTQYDTYVKNPVSVESYFGYIYTDETKVSAIEFTEGGHFKDGGWFKNGQVRIEVLTENGWMTAETDISSPYPMGDAQSVFGKDFDTYTFTLKTPVSCKGVRIIGTAGGSSSFISVSELTVR